MFYIKIEANRAVSASRTGPTHICLPGCSLNRPDCGQYETRHNWKSFARVEEIAAQLTEATGVRYLAVDKGAHTSPRYDVIKAPTVGEEVSRYFNGDGYPAGEIAKISPSFKRIETTTGVVFFRRRLTDSWINNGTWGMAGGHRNDRNPSF
jgi:hypothetical protein